jgi:hypothetical protein
MRAISGTRVTEAIASVIIESASASHSIPVRTLRPIPSPTSCARRTLQSTAPMLTRRFATDHGELAFFSMYTTFGTPHDLTLASLRIEHVFPANSATRAVLMAQVIATGARD